MFVRLLLNDRAMCICDRRLYWSDCSRPTTTIQSASAVDGSDRRVIVNDTQHSCISALVVDTNSQSPSHKDTLDTTNCHSMEELRSSPRGLHPWRLQPVAVAVAVYVCGL